MDQRSVIPIAQLVDSIRAADQDENDSPGQKREEDFEIGWEGGFIAAIIVITFSLFFFVLLFFFLLWWW